MPNSEVLPSTITIDGPAASGKSTIGKLLAQRLGYLYFDTGALYRAVTWLALEKGLDVKGEEAITALAREAKITLERPEIEDGRQYTVRANGRDITWEIRRPEVEANVSAVSAYLGVREALREQQRRVGQKGRVVMVGRDIGTAIMPQADLKIYLEASPEVRAQRRYKEMVARGEEASYKEILTDMRRRDEIDSHRSVAPLRPAPDAHMVNTDDLSIEEAMNRVMRLVKDWTP